LSPDEISTIKLTTPLGRLSRGCIKGVLETGAEIIRRRGQLELSIGIRPLMLPSHGIIDQMGKGYMPTTFRQIEISRA
jgi:hypothetical protein